VTDLDQIAALLKSESTLALATCCEDGAPHVAPLFYIAGENLELYWFSSPSSRHSSNLEANRAAAVTVYRPTEEWKEIRGVQMRGVVSIVAAGAQREAEFDTLNWPTSML
jgi:nitroimidazol reductase NimA-like FMN-containing flavoprotein (pyridoxamine 5'-phosphate oxidase superfamily)